VDRGAERVLLYPAPADHPVVARAAVDGVVAAVAEEPVVLCAAADAVVAGEQDRAGVEESNRQAADWVRQNMAPLLPNPPQITAGEVVAHTAK